jgi:PadR family transcriptional regulator, regulatory protein PadR
LIIRDPFLAKKLLIKTAIANNIDLIIFTAIATNIRVMKKTKLGEFEELVLLTVAALQEEAYGVEIKRELELRLKEKLSVGSIQSALKRMEEKGFLTSQFGEATQKRGGKRKRIYATTSYAHKVLAEMKEIRASLWNSIPNFSPQLKTI